MVLRLFAASWTAASAAQTYRAAVVEFAPQYAEASTSMDFDAMRELKLNNIAGMEVFAREAKANATQIIVFPEYGITGDNLPSIMGNPREALGFYPDDESLIVGDNPSVTLPCGNAVMKASAPAIERVSCIAQELEMVTVINILTKNACEANVDGCPSDGFRCYNTNVAFAEDGTVLRIYHKRHGFGNELKFLQLGDDSYKGGVTFTTSFGVKFGMFICFDLVFFTDGGPDAHEIVYSTEWDNDLAGPLPEPASARVVQRGWTTLHRKNMLASNYGGWGKASSGSGLWHKGRPLAQFYNPTNEPQSKLLIADMPIIGRAEVAV